MPDFDQFPPSDPACPAPAAPIGLQVVETTQTVLTALILAFIFRAFLVEAFIIPTGSMAETLLGAHGVYVCPRCGMEFDYTLLRGRGSSDDAPQSPSSLLCDNCELRIELPETEEPPPAKAGDRILVEKWPYLLGGWFGPRRWDVVVFRDPAQPDQNFVKRLIGLPNDEIEIVLGDLFINGQIARKPPAVQRALWTMICDQRRAPAPDFDPAPQPFWITDADPRPRSRLARALHARDQL